jgi:GNAT superfamily N-acetyltransferase
MIHEEDLAETGKMYIYHIDNLSVVRIAPSLSKQMGLPEGYGGDSVSLTANDFKSFLGEQYQVALESTFLDYFLNAKDFVCFRAGGPFITRRLEPEVDDMHLRSLYAACTEEELDAAAICVEEPDPVIYGLFDGGQLVAYASHCYWDNVIADIGVLIHPGYRGRGLGKAVVSDLCEWCIRNDIVSMYRVFSDHIHSRRIPEALGFKQLVFIETLKVS